MLIQTAVTTEDRNAKKEAGPPAARAQTRHSVPSVLRGRHPPNLTPGKLPTAECCSVRPGQRQETVTQHSPTCKALVGIPASSGSRTGLVVRTGLMRVVRVHVHSPRASQSLGGRLGRWALVPVPHRRASATEPFPLRPLHLLHTTVT